MQNTILNYKLLEYQNSVTKNKMQITVVNSFLILGIISYNKLITR